MVQRQNLSFSNLNQSHLVCTKKWRLTKITSSRKHDIIQFTYLWNPKQNKGHVFVTRSFKKKNPCQQLTKTTSPVLLDDGFITLPTKAMRYDRRHPSKTPDIFALFEFDSFPPKKWVPFHDACDTAPCCFFGHLSLTPRAPSHVTKSQGHEPTPGFTALNCNLQ